jgi:electron transfer flavoprotein alpha/beta subunit
VSKATPLRVTALLSGPEDAAALRVATSLGPTTAVTVGPEALDGLLRGALAAGATRAVRVWDDALSKSDYLALAHTIAQTLRALLGRLEGSPTVVVCGDRGRGAVGPAVAERLGAPHVGLCIGAELTKGGIVARCCEGSGTVRYAAPLLSVLCVPPSGTPIASASAGEVELWTLAQSGLNSSELAYRHRYQPRPAAGPTARPRTFTDATALVERLRADGLVRVTT